MQLVLRLHLKHTAMAEQLRLNIATFCVLYAAGVTDSMAHSQAASPFGQQHGLAALSSIAWRLAASCAGWQRIRQIPQAKLRQISEHGYEALRLKGACAEAHLYRSAVALPAGSACGSASCSSTSCAVDSTLSMQGCASNVLHAQCQDTGHRHGRCKIYN